MSFTTRDIISRNKNITISDFEVDKRFQSPLIKVTDSTSSSYYHVCYLDLCFLPFVTPFLPVKSSQDQVSVTSQHTIPVALNPLAYPIQKTLFLNSPTTPLQLKAPRLLFHNESMIGLPGRSNSMSTSLQPSASSPSSSSSTKTLLRDSILSTSEHFLPTAPSMLIEPMTALNQLIRQWSSQLIDLGFV